MRKKRKKIVNARIPLKIFIEQRHVKVAKCSDPEGCVLAQAILGSIGELFERVLVGSTITKIITHDRVIRYRTPNAIKKAIPIFDATGAWNLPPGTYNLGAVTKKEGRHKLIKGKATPGKLVNFHGRPLPTRDVTRAEVLCAVQNPKSKKKAA